MPAGWSAAQWKAYKASIPFAAAWASQVSILDLSQNHLESVPAASFLEGQWNILADGDVDRTFQGAFFDIGGALAPHFDPAVAPSRLIQVRQGTFVDALGAWLWVTTFTGRPHVTTDGGGGSWSIEAQGKDCLHNRGVPAQVFRNGEYVVDAIRNYLMVTGERFLDIPSRAVIGKRLAADIKFGGAEDQMTPIAAMRKAASLVGCQLYWTGAGVATVRKWPQDTAPVVSWDERTVMSVPTYSTDMSTLKNRWTGGGKQTLRADISASGPYSPDMLHVGGVPWSNIDFGEDDESLTSAAVLAARGRARVTDLVTLSTKVDCSVIPFHATDPMDIAEVRTPERTEKTTIRDASIPVAGAWTGGEAPVMSIGSRHSTLRGSYGRVRSTGSVKTATKKRRR